MKRRERSPSQRPCRKRPRTATRPNVEFLAVLAHELRNPLAPIRTAVETLKLTAQPDPAVRRASDIIERQVAHLAGLVDDLLDVARIARGKMALKPERIDLGDVVRDAVEACRPLVAAARHELVVSVPAERCPVAGDFRRLVQVVSNLLSNAVKFTPAGGRIAVLLTKDGASSVLRVRDNGRGMDAATTAHAFDMFYQSAGDGERCGGLGIGLALVKKLVSLHRGSVEAVSDGRGRGCEFIVRLPCIGDEARAARTAGAERSSASRRKGARRVGSATSTKRAMHDAG